MPRGVSAATAGRRWPGAGGGAITSGEKAGAVHFFESVSRAIASSSWSRRGANGSAASAALTAATHAGRASPHPSVKHDSGSPASMWRRR